MAPQSLYIQELRKRRANESLRSNVIFGQTLGWVLSLVGAFHYFILLETYGFYLLMVGNLLLLLGVALPYALEIPNRIVKGALSFISSLMLKPFLSAIYFLVVFPSACLSQAVRGKTPFYAWSASAKPALEGWTDKKDTSDADMISSPARKLMHMPLLEVFRHFLNNSDLVIMPSLLLVLLLGLLAVFVQATVVAPMIYTLF